jgi:hypothetical protein
MMSDADSVCPHVVDLDVLESTGSSSQGSTASTTRLRTGSQLGVLAIVRVLVLALVGALLVFAFASTFSNLLAIVRLQHRHGSTTEPFDSSNGAQRLHMRAIKARNRMQCDDSTSSCLDNHFTLLCYRRHHNRERRRKYVR